MQSFLYQVESLKKIIPTKNIANLALCAYNAMFEHAFSNCAKNHSIIKMNLKVISPKVKR